MDLGLLKMRYVKVRNTARASRVAGPFDWRVFGGIYDSGFGRGWVMARYDDEGSIIVAV